MVYTAQGVFLDGTNDYLARGADLAGNADSKLLSGSLWARRASTGVAQRVWRSDGDALLLIFTAGDTFRAVAENAAGTTILNVETSAITSTTVWQHIMFSFDLTDTGKRHLYVNDAPDLTVTTYTDDTIDFTRSDHGVGASDSGILKYHGDMADFWLAPGQYIDLSVESNRRKFIGPNGGVVDLGS